MKFVLIVVIAATAGAGTGSAWDQPTISMAEFDSERACKAAAEVVRTLLKEVRVENPRFAAYCAPGR